MEKTKLLDNTTSVPSSDYTSQPGPTTTFVHWSWLYKNKNPIDPIFDHIYDSYRPHYPYLLGGIPSLRFQIPQSSSAQLQFTWGFDSKVFSRTWRESGLPKVVPLEMSVGIAEVPTWLAISIYHDMAAAHRWVDAILDQWVESQSKTTSPGFEAAASQYALVLPVVGAPLEEPIHDRWAMLIDFLSEPYVRRFVEHLILVLLAGRYATVNNHSFKEQVRPSTIEDVSTGSADELPKGKNYKKNLKKSERNRKKRQVASISGESSGEITPITQEGGSVEPPEESLIVGDLLDAGVPTSALEYLLVSIPTAVASALVRDPSNSAANAAALEKKMRDQDVNIPAPREETPSKAVNTTPLKQENAIDNATLKEKTPIKAVNTTAPKEETSSKATNTTPLKQENAIDTTAPTKMTPAKTVNAASFRKKTPKKAVNTAALEQEVPTKNVNMTSLKAVNPADTLTQPDDSMDNRAASNFEATSRGQEDANDLPSLDHQSLDLQTSACGIHQLAGDDVVADGSTITMFDQTQVEGCAGGSESGESADTDTPPVLTFDGRSACEVDNLTLEDHPETNKFMEIKFNCEYCQNETSESYDSETAIFCPGCGPCSAIRYCSKTCLLADCTLHQPICGLQPGDYPVIWNWTPSHMQSKFPYIKPIGGNMSRQCFRQMVYAAVIDSEGVITLPYIAHYKLKMPEHHRKYIKARMEAPDADKFISKGDYHIFVTAIEPDYTGDTGLDLTIDMPPEMSHQFRRARNAAWLTQDMKLIRFVFHMIRLNVNNYNIDFKGKGENFVDWNFVRGFSLEFPSFNRHRHKDIVFSENCNMLEAFENEWPQIEVLVKNLELKHPILRSWMTDPDPEALPVDPATRYTGLQWLRQDPWEEKFIEGDPTKEWGVGWNGTMSDAWKFLLPEQKDEKAEKAAKEWNEILHGPKEDGHPSWKGFRD